LASNELAGEAAVNACLSIKWRLPYDTQVRLSDRGNTHEEHRILIGFGADVKVYAPSRKLFRKEMPDLMSRQCVLWYCRQDQFLFIRTDLTL